MSVSHIQCSDCGGVFYPVCFQGFNKCCRLTDALEVSQSVIITSQLNVGCECMHFWHILANFFIWALIRIKAQLMS